MNLTIILVLASLVTAEIFDCEAETQCQCETEKPRKKRKKKNVPTCAEPTTQNGISPNDPLNEQKDCSSCDFISKVFTFVFVMVVSRILFKRKSRRNIEEKQIETESEKPKPPKLKTYLHHQNVNVLLQKENAKLSAENVELNKKLLISCGELDQVKGDNEQMQVASDSANFYLRAIETVSKANEQLERQIEQQRNNHKQSTAELRIGFKEMSSKSRTLKVKFTMIAAFLTKLNPECSVCFNEYNENQRAVMINCIHIICEKCALSWLEKTKTLSASCPTCRTSYRSEHLTFLQ